MYSEHVQRNYANLWPRVISARFGNSEHLEAVLALFASYDGPEPDRVKLGILKAADCDIQKIHKYFGMAKSDWRDLLCEAEYPRSARRFGLKERSPEKYQRLLAKEQEEYESWLQRVLAT